MNLAADIPVEEHIRDAPPTHYSLKIQYFSKLSTNDVQKYESCTFEVGDYKWKLLLYPTGDPARKVDDHISLYLAIDEKANTLPSGWEVNAIYTFFVYDQVRDKYLTLRDAAGTVRRFHGIRKKWGMSQLISLARFNDPTNGFLVDDACEFGVEILLVQNTIRSECLSMLGETSSYKHTWKVENFSQLTEEVHYSDIFTAGSHRWKIKLYPKGTSEGKNNSLSLYLFLADRDELHTDEKLYVHYKFQLKDMIRALHEMAEAYYWFKNTTSGYGWPKFVSMEDFKDPAKGYLVSDAFTLEAEVTILGSRKKNTLTNHLSGAD